MLSKKTIASAFLLTIAFFSTAVGDTNLLESNAINKINKSINNLSSKVSESLSSFAMENFTRTKYLDLEINAQEYLKPTISIMSVNEIFKLDQGTVFNQTSLSTHDSDETINFGIGIRKISNDNSLIIGSNIFYDYQFSEQHQRIGGGIEAISSIFDLRSNYYSARSDQRTTDEGTFEKAMDGWDIRADYHLPIEPEVNLFVSAFKFKNPGELNTYEEIGNKIGADAKLGNFLVEAGYLNDNQENDSYFGSIKYVLNFGANVDEKNTPKKKFSLADVSDKLYQPVKRENKIRVAKISASGVVVGGF
jgi:hypothetical protein